MKRSKKQPKKEYKISGVYDTETTTIWRPADVDGITVERPRAFPVLFIANKIAGTIVEYEPEINDDVRYYRQPEQFLSFIEELITESEYKYIPIICAYNLMFDLQPLMAELEKRYVLSVNAQSSKNAYTVDLADDEHGVILRFWDTFHLEPRGLWAMGEAAGLPKADGDWDYSKIRTPETPLTERELYYAKRDVQVIPAYLKYILRSNSFLSEQDLGTRLITKTSLVRLMAKEITGKLTVATRKGDRPLELLMRLTCKTEAPKDYDTYARRKACFRGGLTFTAANYANQLRSNVLSIDAVSMHHAHINGMRMFIKFHKLHPYTLKRELEVISKTPVSQVLKEYEKPFKWAVHVHVRIRGLRLKKNSVFEKAGIATLAEAKCSGITRYEGFSDPKSEAAEEATRKRGYGDAASGSPEQPRVYAYSKLFSADVAELYLTEYEWYILNLVYDYDSFEVLDGESSSSATRAPEYVTLLSNMLYNQKDELKQILKQYDGTPMDIEKSTLPRHIVDGIREGELSPEYLESFYKNIIKGSYNSIYGSQAQDVYKPGFTTDENGSIVIDDETIATPENFKGAADAGLVLYTYGMRIVGRSRLHLVLAMVLLNERFGDRIRILGGDTDSLKIEVDDDITDDEIITALEPLHEATRTALFYCQKEIKKNFPDYASELSKLGEFEIETYDGGKFSRYKWHIELWNKCRISVDYNDRVHITCAGVSRPEGRYTLEDLATDMFRKYGTEVLYHIAGYNVMFDPSIAYLLAHSNPEPTDKFEAEVYDYTGRKSLVSVHESVALTPTGKTIGDLTKLQNIENITYKHERGEQPETRPTYIFLTPEKGIIEVDYTSETPILYEVNRG